MVDRLQPLLFDEGHDEAGRMRVTSGECISLNMLSALTPGSIWLVLASNKCLLAQQIKKQESRRLAACFGM